MKNLTASKVALELQQQYRGIRMLLARCLDKRDQGHEAFVADYTQATGKCARPYAGSHNISEALAGTLVKQVERPWIRSR